MFHTKMKNQLRELKLLYGIEQIWGIIPLIQYVVVVVVVVVVVTT